MRRTPAVHLVDRRSFLQSSSAFATLGFLGLNGCTRQIHTASAPAAPAPPIAALPIYDQYTPLIPIRAHADRIFRITVCSRPFRATGPRLDVERLADKYVVHNYGHGGSGWSLSWGSAQVAVKSAMAGLQGSQEVAVIGAGALGLTAATLLQREGLRVTIYAKERAPYTRSSRATGSWTPSSRIALASSVTPDFAATWESMARASFFFYQSFYGISGAPVEWTDRWNLSDYPSRRPDSPTPNLRPEAPAGGRAPQHDFMHLDDRIADLTPRPIDMPPGSHPFPTPYVSRSSSITFNVADYSRLLLTDFLIAGGRIETREFHSPQDLTALPQKVIVNCPGYGARALWKDESIVPVRGQIAWLIPQEDAHYGLQYKGLNVLARRDGIVLQSNGIGEDEGWNNPDETPDRADAETSVAILADLYRRMQAMPRPRT